MKRFLFGIAGTALYIVDGLVWPPLSGHVSGLAVIIFLAGLAVTFGVHRRVIGWGIAVAFAAELMLGLYFGSLIVAWLMMCWTWYLLSNFLSLKSLKENDSWLSVVPLAACGILLSAVALCSQWAIVHWLYDGRLSITTLRHIATSPTILITGGVEMLFFLVVVRCIYTPSLSVYA